MSLSIVDVHCSWGPTAAAPNWNDADVVCRELAARGITQAFLSSTLARRYDPVGGNDTVAEIVSSSPPSCDLKGWLVAHAAQLDEAGIQLRRYLYTDLFVGMAVYPDPIKGRPVTYEDYKELFQTFRRYAKPLLIEVCDADGMLEAVGIAQALQGIKVIASGMGGDDWRTSVELAAKPINLFLDISGALAPDKIGVAVRAVGGVRKLLFASGAPATEPAAILSLVEEANLSHDEKTRLLSGNARRIFGGHDDDEAAAPISLSPMGAG